MSEQEKKQENMEANEPEVAYGNNLDSLKLAVIDAVKHIQDVNILEGLLSFINKAQPQEDIPNEVTLAAMREAENGEGLEVLDVEHFKDFVASL